MEHITRDLQIWNKLNLSMIGRIAAIKMMVLQRLMFLFQALPIICKSAMLDRWQRQLVNFVWVGEKARIKLKALCDLKKNGGLQLPNLRMYFEQWDFLGSSCGLNWKTIDY